MGPATRATRSGTPQAYRAPNCRGPRSEGILRPSFPAPERTILDALGNIGDFLGGIGVVVTLVYLAVQIRQNTEQLRRGQPQAAASIVDETVRSFNQWREHIATDRATAELWTLGLEGSEQLDDVDRMRFELLLGTYFYKMQALYRRTRNTGLDDHWEKSRSALARLLSNRGVAAY